MEATTEPKRRRKKAAVSALTATFPISGGGEMPLLVELPKAAKPRRKRTPAKKKAPPQIVAVPVPEPDIHTFEMTLPGLDLRALVANTIEPVGPPPPAAAPPIAEVAEPEPVDYVPAEPVAAMYSGTRVGVIAISAKRVKVVHQAPLATEGDIVLRVPGLFAELSRMSARILTSDGERTILELTRNAVFATFAIDALRNSGPRLAVAPIPEPAVEDREPEKAVRQIRVLGPTRALPATFGDSRVALLEVSDRSVRVAHSKPLPLEGEHLFTIRTEVADFSGSVARVMSWEQLEDGRDVYVSTLEVTGNAVSFACGIDALIGAGLLQERTAPVTDVPEVVEAEAPMPPQTQRDIRPLVPVVRLRKTNPLPRRHPRPSLALIAATILIVIVGVLAYIRRPDDHFRRATKMIDAYEQGLMPGELDYSLPVYSNTLRELARVRPSSVSHGDAQRLADRIRRAVAQKQQRDAVKAAMQP